MKVKKIWYLDTYTVFLCHLGGGPWLANFSVKCQIVNILDCEGLTISGAIILLQPHSALVEQKQL